ncbi:hypothetical protein GCM10007079_05340 [Nocardiopsis terrae]|nr:hypothetical protein GCM10007079_05340 [Nocardiopsis terrae]
MRNLIPHLRTPGPTRLRTAKLSPCVRLPFTPPPPAHPVAPLAKLVRPYVVDGTRHRPVELADQSRLGLELLLEISRLEAAAA